MYMRKLCQYCPRLFGRFQLRAAAVSQNAIFCDHQLGSKDKVLEDQNGVSSTSVNESKAQNDSMKEIAARKAQMFLDNLDEDGLKKIEEIKVLMEVLKLENKRVPDVIPPAAWKVFLTDHHTVSSRTKYLGKLFLDECRKKNDLEKKLLKRKARQEQMKNDEDRKPPEVSVHIPTRDVEMKQWKKIQALTSNNNVVFDLDFEQTTRERVHTYDQIQRAWSNNISHLQPLNLHLTSIHKNERLQELLEFSKKPPVNFYNESFLDVFNNEDVVYLTPDGPQMKEFDPSFTYIVGGIVDLSGKARLSYGKAKAHGIRTASFPLNRYCNFSITDRARHILTLDCVLRILTDMFLYHSWKTVLRKNFNERYVFWDDMKRPEFVSARRKMIEKKQLARFKRTENTIRGGWK